MNMQLILALCLSAIIIGLAFYIGFLIKRIKQQKIQLAANEAQKATQLAQKQQQRNDNICSSIRFIARATAQKQCNVSEASIRLSVLLETLLIEPKIDIDKNYPALSGLFAKINGFATHEERKNMDKTLLKQQDKQRKVFEDEFEDAIILEAKSLQNFSI